MASWATLQTRLSPVTITETPFSTFNAGVYIAFNNHFLKLIPWYDSGFDYSNRAMDLMTSLWRPYPLDHQLYQIHRRKREALSCWESLPQPNLQIHWESLILDTISIPDLLKKGRGLACIINEVHCTQPKKSGGKETIPRYSINCF